MNSRVDGLAKWHRFLNEKDEQALANTKLSSMVVDMRDAHTYNHRTNNFPYELLGGWNRLMMFPAGSLIAKARPKGSSDG
jgi:hypothetical protein